MSTSCTIKKCMLQCFYVQCTCLDNSVGKSTCLVCRVPRVQVPSEAARFSWEMTLLGVLLNCLKESLSPSACSSRIATPQEVFSAVRDRYMRDGEGFILVYSLTERATFAPISKISEQIKRVKDTDQHVPIVLVGNKVSPS